MLPKEQLLRLSQEQEKTLLKTKSQLEQFKKFKSDYEILAQHLTTLPHRLEYPMMIPFGKKAFIPGKLVRTNELLVLLGENWFVECSAKYACEIVKRRIEHADKQIADASKERDNISSHLKYTQEFSADNGNSNIHDIVEYEDEHGEITTIRGPNLEGGDKRLSKEEQARAIARVEAEMEELERIEQSLEDDNPTQTESDLLQLTDLRITRDNTALHTPTILFHHSSTEVIRPEFSTENTQYISPADLYDKSPEIVRKTQKMKEIIEKSPAKKVTWGENTVETYEKTENLGLATTTQIVEKAFTKIVKERSHPIVSPTTELPEENRIVSKFKSSRIKSNII